MSTPTRLAAAQTVARAGDLSGNLARHLHLARSAAERGAALVLFPELSLTGYELELAADLALDEQDPRLDPLRELAAEADITLVVGAPVRCAERLHLAAVVLGPEGPDRLYTKQRLGAFPAHLAPRVPPPEPTVFVPGDRDPLLEGPYGRAALAICADTGLAGHADRAAARGATCYLASMFFTPPEWQDEARRLSGFAATHRMHVLMANHGAPTGGLDAAGGSAAWGPDGELLQRLPGPGEGLLVVDLPHGSRPVV